MTIGEKSDNVVKNSGYNLMECHVLIGFQIVLRQVLYFGSIRMNILMLDTRNVEQTKDVRMYT